MYGRTIIFTLLAPSLWSVIEAAARPLAHGGVSRYLFKSSDNSGFVTEVFADQGEAGKNLDTLKAIQGLKEQAMAKVTIIEGATK
tara:strand:+ start:713 stop:967 length:255 start_codon:yes stop_codon:yes gene_type:complete